MSLKLLLSVGLPACALGGRWTPTVNTYNNVLDWLPTTSAAITGFESQHSNTFQDRTWQIHYESFPGVSESQVTSAYANTWDGNFREDWSDQHRILTGVLSYHNNHYEDRLWKFRTARVSGDRSLTDCNWLGWTVDDLYFKKACPTNKYIAGVNSDHYNNSQDRRFQFLCCAVATKAPTKQPTTKQPTKQPTDSPTYSQSQMSKMAHLDYTVGEENGVVYKCSGEFEAVTCYQFDADKNSWTHMTSEPPASMGQGTVETDAGSFSVDDFGLTLNHQDGLQHYWPWECGCSA